MSGVHFLAPQTRGAGQADELPSSCSCWAPVLPQEPVCQQSAHPREVFKQKERATSTTLVSSCQPGNTSLCLAMNRKAGQVPKKGTSVAEGDRDE